MNLDNIVEKYGISFLILFVILLALCFECLTMKLQTIHVLTVIYLLILLGVPRIWQQTKEDILTKEERKLWLVGSALICIFLFIIFVCMALPFWEIILRILSLLLTLIISMEQFQSQYRKLTWFSKCANILYSIITLFCIIDTFFKTTFFLIPYTILVLCCALCYLFPRQS